MMEREEITRSDFPTTREGYDRRSVDAHLEAVAAHVDALTARIGALGIEMETLRATGSSIPSGVEGSLVVSGGSGRQEVEGRPPAATGPPNPNLSDDPVSARLVVSKMHLDGTGRDEIIERLGATHRLEDPERLVDEVIEGLS